MSQPPGPLIRPATTRRRRPTRQQIARRRIGAALAVVLVAVLVIAGLQLTLFAMWFDMEANKDLR